MPATIYPIMRKGDPYSTIAVEIARYLKLRHGSGTFIRHDFDDNSDFHDWTKVVIRLKSDGFIKKLGYTSRDNSRYTVYEETGLVDAVDRFEHKIKLKGEKLEDWMI